MKVLIIEDNDILNEMWTYLLRHRGDEVVSTHTANEGIEAFHHKGPFDLVLVNLGLHEGKEHGFSVVEQLRRVDKETEMWITSGSMDRLREIRAAEVGANKALWSLDVMEALEKVGLAPLRSRELAAS